MAMDCRSANAIFGVKVAKITAASSGPMVAENVVKLLSAVSSIGRVHCEANPRSERAATRWLRCRRVRCRAGRFGNGHKHSITAPANKPDRYRHGTILDGSLSLGGNNRSYLGRLVRDRKDHIRGCRVSRPACRFQSYDCGNPLSPSRSSIAAADVHLAGIRFRPTLSETAVVSRLLDRQA